MAKGYTHADIINGVVVLAKVAVPGRAVGLKRMMFVSELPFYHDGKMDLSEITTPSPTRDTINEMRLVMVKALDDIRTIRDKAIQELAIQAATKEMEEAHS